MQIVAFFRLYSDELPLICLFCICVQFELIQLMFMLSQKKKARVGYDFGR